MQTFDRNRRGEFDQDLYVNLFAIFIEGKSASGILVSAQVADGEDQIIENVEDMVDGEEEGDATVETDEGTPLEPGTDVTEGEKVGDNMFRFVLDTCMDFLLSEIMM